MPDSSVRIQEPNLRQKLKDMGEGHHAPVSVDGGGQAGVTVTTNTSAVTGTFSAIQILEDATFSVFTESGASASGQAMTGFSIPAGTVLFGRITAYTLTSGKVRAYV